LNQDLHTNTPAQRDSALSSQRSGGRSTQEIIGEGIVGFAYHRAGYFVVQQAKERTAPQAERRTVWVNMGGTVETEDPTGR
jgi:hypothetical protein